MTTEVGHAVMQFGKGWELLLPSYSKKQERKSM